MERMCGVPILKKSSYTIKDIYALPEEERAELIDGRIYAMAPPNGLHQKLVMELSKAETVAAIYENSFIRS